MQKPISRFLIFLVLNFTALGIGGLFTGPGVASDWYQTMAKAPWTPPGWVFGAAWTSIMICFSFYMTILSGKLKDSKSWILLFPIQWFLNVSWNPVFFHYQQMEIALILIISLTVVVGIFFFKYWKDLKLASLLVLPYLLWLIIATSLNAYPLLVS